MKILLPVLFVCTLGVAQENNQSSLQLKEIMKGEGFIGRLPHSVHWMPNGTVEFSWDTDNNRVDEHYRLDAKTGKYEAFTQEELLPIPNGWYSASAVHEYGYYTKGKSLYKWQVGEGAPSEIAFNLKGYRNVQGVSDKDVVYYQEGSNLVRFDTKNATVKQVTNFKKGGDPAKKSVSKYEQYLLDQQKELSPVLNEKNRIKEANKAGREALEKTYPGAIYTADQSVENLSVSPDEKYVTYVLTSRPESDPTQLENYVTISGWSSTIKARPKVGRPDPTHQFGIYNTQTKAFTYLALDDLPGIKKKPEFLQEYHKGRGDWNAETKNPKNVLYHGPYYSPDGKRAVIEIKSYDNKDRWIAELIMETGELTHVIHQHDRAWIGGPGISGWNEVPGNIGWMKDNHTIYFQSEETGYSHLYTYDLNTDEKKALTEGKYEVHEADLSNDGSKFYITANKKHPGNREFYHLDVKTGKWIEILTQEGNHEVVVSPDEKMLAYRYSYKNKPWEIYLMENKKGGKPRQVTQSTSDAFKAYKWRAPEVITFQGVDGGEVYARVYEPEASKKNNAAVIFVHGAGYLQNAHNWWSGYYREYMFHNMLVDNGYTVMDIDYRASKGYGRDCRTAIYRHMGGMDLNDQISGADYLVEKYGVDEDKLGIYGGSYGGFITIMAMLNFPDKFQCGGAIRSVTDWAHYNHEYTSNILNTPVQDSLAFRRSSPIYFAEKLKGKLLMLHGMVDDNVQYQDVVRLSQRFIELGVTNWDLIGYPVEPHGFKETSSWVDEYGRIYKMFGEELLGK